MREIWLLLDSRGIGGIESHVAELAVGLLEAGDRPRVLFLADHGPHPLRQRLDREGVPWEALSGGLSGLLARCRTGRPRVLHTHGYKANILGRIAGTLTRTPLVATYHAGERPGGLLAVYDLMDRWTSGLGARIAVSRPIQARMPFGATLIPNFVDVPIAPPQKGTSQKGTSQKGTSQKGTSQKGTSQKGSSQMESTQPGPAIVAFVGRMAPEKGPDHFCAIARDHPQASHVAFGDGPMRLNLQSQVGESVRFAGAVTNMAETWPQIGLLVISSRAEGLPLAALEAMANGVPVAAFALGGLPDLIEDDATGYLAAPGDVAGLSERVGKWLALSTSERAAMALAAWRAVSARHGRPGGVAAVRALYAGA